MSTEVDQYNFYLKFIKPMVLNLPDAKDRATAALWLKKLGEINTQNPENDLHVKYLMLLLFALHKKKLGGIFEKPPPDESLEPFPEDHTVVDMIHLVKSEETKQTKFPSINSSVSADLCEFVSVQEIPNFGVQGYYAVSTEPLTKQVQQTRHMRNVDLQRTRNPGEIQRSIINALRRWIRPTTGRPVMHIPCYKDTCKLSKLSNYKSNEASSRDQTGVSSEATVVPNDQTDESTKGQESQNGGPDDSKNDWDTSLFPRRFSKMEIPFLESRPCWGTNRYIERLIDQSPHIVGDLDLSEADAILHFFKDKKMKVVKKSSITGLCRVSSKRREVERMMDLPPCARDPGDVKSSSEESIKMHTCLPKGKGIVDISCTDYCIPDDERLSSKRPGKVIGISSKSRKMQDLSRTPKRAPTPRKLFTPDSYYSDWVSGISDATDMTSLTGLSDPSGNPDTIQPRSRQNRSAELEPVDRRELPGYIPPPPPLPPTPFAPHPTVRSRVTRSRLPEPERSYRQVAQGVPDLALSLHEQPFVLPPHVTVRSPRRRLSESRSLTDSSYPELDTEFEEFEAFNRGSEPEAYVSFLQESHVPLRYTESGSPDQQETDDEFAMSLSRGSDPEAYASFVEESDIAEAPGIRGRSFTRSPDDSTIRGINRGFHRSTHDPSAHSGFVSLRNASSAHSGIASDDSYLPLGFAERAAKERQNFPQRSYRSEDNRFLRVGRAPTNASAFVPLQSVSGKNLKEPAPVDFVSSQELQRSKQSARRSRRSPIPPTSSSFSDIDDDPNTFVPVYQSTFIEN